MLECVLARRLWLRFWGRGVKVLDRFALHEDRVGTFREYCFDRKLVCHAHVADGATKRRFIRQGFVPESTERRETGTDEDLIHGSVIAHPRISARELARVFS